MPQVFAKLTLEQRARKREQSRRGVAKWRAKNPAKATRRDKRQSWVRQGIDPNAAERAVAENDGTCDCCAKAFKSSYYRHVDHDHETGVVRGVLCADCNVGIGRLGDDAAGVRRALDYLTKQ